MWGFPCSLVQIHKYSSTIARETFVNDSNLGDEPFAALVSDGQRVIAAICTPSITGGSVLASPIHKLAANNGRINWTASGLKAACWFIFMTEVSLVLIFNSQGGHSMLNSAYFVGCLNRDAEGQAKLQVMHLDARQAHSLDPQC